MEVESSSTLDEISLLRSSTPNGVQRLCSAQNLGSENDEDVLNLTLSRSRANAPTPTLQDEAAQPLFELDGSGKYIVSPAAAERLSNAQGFSVVGCVGTYRKGKSTFLNLLTAGRSPTHFGVSAGQDSHTRGIMYWLDEQSEILYLDVEGADAPSMSGAKWCEYSLNAMALTLASVLCYYHWEGALSCNIGVVNSLFRFGERLRCHVEAASSTLNGMAAVATQLPAFLWLFRNWDEHGLDFSPDEEYVRKQLGMVDPVLVEHLDRFPLFRSVELSKPIHGRPTPAAFADPSAITAEYKKQLAALREIIAVNSPRKRWSGRAFKTFCEHMVEVVNASDFVPEAFESAVLESTKQMAKHFVTEAEDKYRAIISTVSLPSSESVFRAADLEALGEATKHFESLSFGLLGDADLEKYSGQLDSRLMELSALYKGRNEDKSVICCQALIAPLQERFIEDLQSIEIPMPSTELEAAFRDAYERAASKYDESACGIESIIAKHRSLLTDSLGRLFQEREKENVLKSESVCTAQLEPCLRRYRDSVSSLELPVTEQRLSAELDNARNDAVGVYLHAALRACESVREDVRRKLEELMERDTSEIMEKNTKLTAELVRSLIVPCSTMYKDEMGGVMASAGCLSTEPFEAAHQKALHTALNRLRGSAKRVIVSYHEHAANDTWGESDRLDSAAVASFLSGLSSTVREAGEEILQNCEEARETYWEQNLERAEELCGKVVEEAYNLYDAKMKLIDYPIPQKIFLCKHNSSTTDALTHFRTGTIGGDVVVRKHAERLKELIRYGFRHYFSTNDVCEMKGLLIKRGGRIHNWKLRQFYLRNGRLQYFEVKGSDVKQKGSIQLSEIIEVQSCETIPPAKTVRQLDVEAHKNMDLNLTTSSVTSNTTGWDQAFAIVTKGRTYVLVAENKRMREIWVLALLNACRLGVRTLDELQGDSPPSSPSTPVPAELR